MFLILTYFFAMTAIKFFCSRISNQWFCHQHARQCIAWYLHCKMW